uniref:FKB95-like N-terminal Kelch domain-containing protein n=1 Tax=Brassica campestris TaxID=3711 RepID=M4D211_BRACM
MSPHASFVPVGSKTYVFNDLEALSVDCASHTLKPISDMPQRMLRKVANVVDGKVYLIAIRVSTLLFTNQRENKWELMNEVLNSKERWEGACVIDDVLYYHDPSGEKAFSRWSVVNGLEEFLAAEGTDQSMWSRVVKCGEKKLALFFPKKRDGAEVICCAEIALEWPQGGGVIWGKVLSLRMGGLSW